MFSETLEIGAQDMDGEVRAVELADYAEHPIQFAIAANDGRLDAVLAPLASDTVTTIVGFTELAAGSRGTFEWRRA